MKLKVGKVCNCGVINHANRKTCLDCDNNISDYPIIRDLTDGGRE